MPTESNLVLLDELVLKKKELEKIPPYSTQTDSIPKEVQQQVKIEPNSTNNMCSEKPTKDPFDISNFIKHDLSQEENFRHIKKRKKEKLSHNSTQSANSNSEAFEKKRLLLEKIKKLKTLKNAPDCAQKD